MLLGRQHNKFLHPGGEEIELSFSGTSRPFEEIKEQKSNDKLLRTTLSDSNSSGVAKSIQLFSQQT